MAFTYTHTKFKDIHTLTNTGTVSFTYTIETVNCETTEVLSTGTLLPTKAVTLNFVKDGHFRIELVAGSSNTSFLITSFNNLLVSFITAIEGLICGCSKCSDCEECNQCEDYLGAFMKAQAFLSVNNPLYNTAYQSYFTANTCLITEQIVCSLLNEKVYGTPITKDVMLYLLSCYYLSFYSVDVSTTGLDEEISYIIAKYKTNKIFTCLHKIGIITEL